MGLDMYLNSKNYVKNWTHMSPEEKHVISIVKGDGSPTKIDVSRISYVIEEIGYWRKANHIHRWFVENVQGGKDDCGDYYVDPDKLKELLAICQQVKADHSLAATLLPTQKGFFFGGTEYDEYYFKDIDDTIRIIETAQNADGDLHYHSSW